MRPLLTLLTVLTVGCGIPTKPPKTNIAVVPDTQPAIPDGHALVVFTRHAGYGPFQTMFVFDDQERFVGEIKAGQRLHVVVPAGKHTFVGWAHAVFGDYGTPSLVTGVLEAGRAYHVVPRDRGVPFQLIALPVSVKPGCEDAAWSLAYAKRIGPDPQYDPATHRPEKVKAQIASAKKRYSKLGEKKRQLWEFSSSSLGTWESFFVRQPPADALEERERLLLEIETDGPNKKQASALLEELRLAYLLPCDQARSRINDALGTEEKKR